MRRDFRAAPSPEGVERLMAPTLGSQIPLLARTPTRWSRLPATLPPDGAAGLPARVDGDESDVSGAVAEVPGEEVGGRADHLHRLQGAFAGAKGLGRSAGG